MKLSVFKKFIISIIVLVIVALGLVVYGFLNATPPENDVLLFDNYYIYRYNSLYCKIYQKDYFDNEKGYAHDKTIYNGWIYKYSFDSENKIVVMHVMTGTDLQFYDIDDLENVLYTRFYGTKEYAITEDVFSLYNGETDESITFDSEKLLNNYCINNNVNLMNWYFPAGNGFVEEEKNIISDNCYIRSWLYDYSSLILNGKEIAFGYITDLKHKGDVITFRLRQTKNEYSPEQINANAGLSPLSQKPIGKYREDFFSYSDIYYDKEIAINVVSGEIREISS